ncbi:hypothetical protein CU072_10750 [Bacillus thuringiensis]|nr:hypothetical protein CU072_10750 [Bacillus thuringiensis]
MQLILFYQMIVKVLCKQMKFYIKKSPSKLGFFLYILLLPNCSEKTVDKFKLQIFRINIKIKNEDRGMGL